MPPAVGAQFDGPSNNLTFDQVIASTSAVILSDYLFGTSVSPGLGQTAIGNCTQLQTYFNVWGDSMLTGSDTGTGANGQNYNNDLERFQACNSTNFVFSSSALTLTAVNEQQSTFQTSITTGNGVGDPYTCSTGTPCVVPLGTLGFTATGTSSFSGTGTCTGTTLDITATSQGGLYQGNIVAGTGIAAGSIVVNAPAGNLTGNYTLSQSCTSSGATITSSNAPSVGQLLLSEFRGIYLITSISANTSLSLAPILSYNGVGINFNNATVLLPWYAGALSATLSNGATGASFTAIPAGCTTGMYFAAANGTTLASNSTNHIGTIVGNAVTFSSAGTWTYAATINPGALGFCMQPISSAQIASTAYYMPGGTARVVAFDAYVTLPSDSTGGYNMLTSACAPKVISAATVASVPANFPWGAFPSEWIYWGNYPSTPSAGGTSEIDFLTMRYYVDTGPWVDEPGFYNDDPPPTINYTQFPFVTSTSACGTGANVFLTTAPNNIYTGASLAGAHRLSELWRNDKIWIYLDNVLVKVMNYSWTSQGWGQMQFQMPVGNFGASGRDLAVPLLQTNFASYTYGLTEFKTLVVP